MIRDLKYIGFLVCFILAVHSAKARFTQEQIKEVGKHCKAVEADLDVALKYEVPETSTGKCLMTCILKTTETLNSEGLYTREPALKSLKKYWSEVELSKLEDLATKCQTIVQGQEALLKSDPCEYGYKVALCVNQYFKNLMPAAIASKK